MQKLDQPGADYLASALAGAGLAESLIRQLLSFTRRDEFDLESVDVNGVIRDIQVLLRQAAGERVQIVLQLDETLTSIAGDRTQLETALL
jgi:signal transduction histidine kinase